MNITNVLFLRQPKGQIGRNAVWRGGYYIITGTRNGGYLLATVTLRGKKSKPVWADCDEVKVL